MTRMKRNIVIVAFVFCAAMVLGGRSRIDLKDAKYYFDGYYYDDGNYCDYWFGPGWYWGVYFYDAPTYFAWRHRHEGGPCYWRPAHRYQK